MYSYYCTVAAQTYIIAYRDVLFVFYSADIVHFVVFCHISSIYALDLIQYKKLCKVVFNISYRKVSKLP